MTATITPPPPCQPAAGAAIAPAETVVLQARDSIFAEQVFLCTRGRRHPVHSAERLEEGGFRWPADLEQTSERMLRSFRPAGPVPSPAPSWPPADSMGMREWLAADLTGTGLEIGAGASPFPVPLGCRVLYGDRLTYEQLTAAPETLTTTVAIATLVMRAAQPFSSHIRSEARQSRGSSPTRFGLLRRRRRLRTAPQRCVTMLQQHASFLSCAMSEFMLRRTAAWDTNLRRWPAALWRRYLPCTAHSRKSSDC